MIAEALASSGGHDTENVTAIEDVFDHLALARAKIVERESLLERGIKVVGVGCHRERNQGSRRRVETIVKG